MTEPFPLPDSAIETAIAEKVALCVIYSTGSKLPFDASKVKAFSSKEGGEGEGGEGEGKALADKEDDDGLGEDNIIVPRHDTNLMEAAASKVEQKRMQEKMEQDFNIKLACVQGLNQLYTA